jgi:hypothetical protein
MLLQPERTVASFDTLYDSLSHFIVTALAVGTIIAVNVSKLKNNVHNIFESLPHVNFFMVFLLFECCVYGKELNFFQPFTAHTTGVCTDNC